MFIYLFCEALFSVKPFLLTKSEEEILGYVENGSIKACLVASLIFAERECSYDFQLRLLHMDKVERTEVVYGSFYGDDVAFGGDLYRREHTVIGNIAHPSEEMAEYVKANQPEYVQYIAE